MNTRILIIEDNVLTLDEIQTRLEDLGYMNIETAVSGEEAIERAASFRPEFILSDINLGDGIDGIEAVGEINKNRDIPVVYLTAYDDDETLKRAKITEPYAYLIKPLQERDLNIAISIALYKNKTEKKLKEMNRKLQEANEIKDKFFSIIAHDLRGPFSGFLGLSDLLHKDSDKLDTEQIKEISAAMLNSANSVFNLIESLFKWATLQTGQMPFTPEKNNLNDLLNKNIRLLEHTAGKKEIRLVPEYVEPINAVFDYNMITTVVRNLIDNAIKFTDTNGEIRIKADFGKDSLVVSVQDSGLGMDSEHTEKIFKIDKDKIKSGTARERGSGLGLVLCKEFVELHGGTIWVESSPGEGSTFSFALPV